MDDRGRPDRVEDRAELFRRSEEHRLRGEHDEQLALLDRIIGIDPASPLAHFAKGTTLTELGRLWEAEAALRTAVQLSPAHSAAERIFLAKVLYQQDSARESEAILRSMLDERLEPISEVAVRSELARVLGRSERSEEALPHVEHAIAVAERADIPVLAAARPTLLQLQAMLLLNLGRAREAAQCLERVVGLRSDNGRDWFQLAGTYSLLERANDAFNALGRACGQSSEWRAHAAQHEDFEFLRSRHAARFAEMTAEIRQEEEALGGDLLAEMKREPRVFISYRRADAADAARSIKRRLEARNAGSRVFLDEDSLEPARQFSEQLAGAIERAHLVLALISPFWETPEGTARINDPNDVVHLEIAWAFRQKISVVPVLVETARMPAPQVLPADIRALSATQALTLRSPRSDADQERLASAIEKIFSDRQARMEDGSHEGKVAIEYTGVLLPPIYTIKSSGAQGVPLAPFEQWYGAWECRVQEAATERIVRFTTEEQGTGHFTGTFEELSGGRRQSEQEIQGVWGVAQDEDTKLIVGLFLEFTIGARSQRALVPFDRRVGDAYVGNSPEGVQHVARNLRPLRAGF